MTETNNWEKYGLRGRVKSAHFEVVEISSASGQEIEKARRPLKTIWFDENGLVSKELLYDLDGNLSEVGSTTHDTNGNQTRVIFQNPKGGLLSSLVSKYDEAGRLLECLSTQARGLIIKQRCTVLYDQEGNKTEETWRYEDGALSRRYVYKYGPSGQLVERLLYNYADDGSIDETWSTLFNEKGNVVETLCFDQDRTEYKYNDQGDRIEIASFDSRGDLYSTTSYSYDFDEKRNWIKQLEVFKTAKSGFETRVVTYRTLEYY